MKIKGFTMEFKEIKEKMTQGEWQAKLSEDPQWTVMEAGTDWGFIVITQQRNDEANANAIAIAVNNTYVKGINPEAVGDLVKAVEMLLLNKQLGEYESQKQGKPRHIEVLDFAEQVLAKAKESK